MKYANVDLDQEAGMLVSYLKDYGQSVKAGETALLLSGGVDSSLLFSIFSKNVHPYTVFYGNSEDLREARMLCEHMGMDLKEIEMTRGDIRECAMGLRDIDPKISLLSLSYEIPLYMACRETEKKYVMTGQGADEIFYGYGKFRDGRETTNKSSIAKLVDETIPREIKITSKFGKVPLMPYMQKSIMERFANMPADQHMSGNMNKIIIRKACEIVGLPERTFLRPKKAAQYGSGIMKALREMKGELGF